MNKRIYLSKMKFAGERLYSVIDFVIYCLYLRGSKKGREAGVTKKGVGEWDGVRLVSIEGERREEA